MDNDRKRRNILGIIGVAASGVIGLVVGLLVAPKTGAQLRADVRRTGGVWKTKAGAKAAELKKSGSVRLKNARQSVGPAVASVREKGASVVTRIGGRRSGTATEIQESESSDAVNESREETAERSR